MNLLIVDDEISVIEGLLGTIDWHALGFTVIRAATSAFEAIRLMEEETVDVVISDIQMPEMNGMELIEAIEKRWNKTKSILLTGHREFSYVQTALRHKVFDYILKPASDEAIIQTVKAAVEAIHSEWSQVSSIQRTMYTFRENLPILRGNLLLKLLQERDMKQGNLERKLAALELPYKPDEHVALLLVRLDAGFDPEDLFSLHLYEYAIGNMAEEVLDGGFHVWSTRDAHDYLVIALKPKGEASEYTLNQGILESQAIKLQACIRQYLKLAVSIVLSRSAVLSNGLADVYNGALSMMRKYAGQGTELFLSVNRDNRTAARIGSLKSPYQPPTLLHLLEAGRWDLAEKKVKEIWLEVADGEEHVMEAMHGMVAAFTCIAHNNGRHLSDIIGSDYSFLLGPAIRLQAKAEDWTMRTLRSIRDDIWQESRDHKSHIVNQIQAYIENHLSADLSLTALASLVHIHPAYLSRLYKEETGTALSDYILKLRMEQAAHLLKHANLKVYEISEQTGYQNVAYFIKVFRNYYRQTPQEFKDQFQPNL